jgi:hypothetical protein
MVEAAVSGSRVALGKSKLKVRLMKIGIAIERESLMVGCGVYHSLEMVIIDVSPIRCAKARGKTCNEPSLTELFVKAIETRDTLIRTPFI